MPRNTLKDIHIIVYLANQMKPVHSISTSAPLASAFTQTQALAGRGSAKKALYASFMVGTSSMLVTYTRTFKTL